MRVFVGIELPEPVRQRAAAAVEDLRAGVQRVAPGVRVRWVDAANLHVTLRFIGEVGDERVTGISAALAAPYSTSTFSLRLAGAGSFPPSGVPRALWLGIHSGSEALAALHAEVEQRLTPLGFEPERRVYAAHLTVARVKEVRRSAVPPIRRVLADAHVDTGKGAVSAVTLFRSRLSPQGTSYESLMRVPLT